MGDEMSENASEQVDGEVPAITTTEPSAAFTPGPWTLEQPEQWPFDLIIRAPDGEVIEQSRRWAHASGQKTVAHCMAGVGFAYAERPNVCATLARQLADTRLRAAAPDLYDALELARRLVDEALPKFDWGKSALDANAIGLLNDAPRAMRAALAKATAPREAASPESGSSQAQEAI